MKARGVIAVVGMVVLLAAGVVLVAAVNRSGEPAPAEVPELSHFDSVQQLVAQLRDAGLNCGGGLQMNPPSDDGFVSGDCPRFDGDDVANIYVFESHDGMVDYFNLDQPGQGPDGAAGDNWLVSVRLRTIADKVARAAEGRVIGYRP